MLAGQLCSSVAQPRLVVRSDGERLPFDALADDATADALGADASGRRAPFGLLDVDGLQVEIEMSLGDAGRFAAVSTEVFGLAAFDLGVASAGNAFANFTRSTHDCPALFKRKSSHRSNLGGAEYIGMPPTCKTEKGFRQGRACIEKVGENFARLFGRERFRWKWWFVDFSIPRKAIMDEIKMAVEQRG